MDRKKEMPENNMSRFSKIAEKLNAYGLDAMMITSWPNRLYATQFKSSAGMVIVTQNESYFFTDTRYIEAANKAITGAVIRMNTSGVTLTDLANEVIRTHAIHKLGFEDQYATVSEYNSWQKKLEGVELVPATGLLMELRQVKDEEEVKCLIAAQRIAEKALKDVLEFIQPGRTEKEISAYLQYRMLCHGAEKMS